MKSQRRGLEHPSIAALFEGFAPYASMGTAGLTLIILGVL
jgi:hypothetical protein